MTNLTTDLASWNGKSAEVLHAVYERHSADADFLPTILAHLADVNLQRAATWLLKRHLELGNSLSAAECRSVLGSLAAQEDWESKLHVLQCLPWVSVAKTRPG